MTAAGHDHLKRDLAVAFTGLPKRTLDRLSCIHSFNPGKLRQWCEQLNVLNVATATPSLISVFKELSAAKLQPREIFDLYIVVQPTLAKVQDSLVSAYSKKRMQLTTQARQSMELAHGLDRAVVTLLKSVLVDAMQVKSGSEAQPLISMIGVHIFIYVAEIMIRLNEFCITIPKGLWRECHSVYWSVMECLCEDFETKQTTFNQYPEVVSVSSLYKGLLLYAIAEPCKYDRHLQRHVLQMMMRLSSFAKLIQQFVPNGLFSVVLTEDLSHVPSRAIEDHNQPEVLHFDMVNVVAALQASPSQYVLTKNSILLQLRERFVDVFTVEKFRTQKRHDLGQPAQCFFGLVQIHSFLQADVIDDEDAEEEQDFYSVGGSAQSVGRPEEVLIKDESQGGYCLEILEKNKLGYSAGDVVFMLAQDIDIMCVIRWTRLQSSGRFLLGVEKLAQEVKSVEFCSQQSGADVQEKGLMFEFEQQNVLLTRVALQKDQHFFLQNSKQSFKVVEVHWLVSGYVKAVLAFIG